MSAFPPQATRKPPAASSSSFPHSAQQSGSLSPGAWRTAAGTRSSRTRCGRRTGSPAASSHRDRPPSPAPTPGTRALPAAPQPPSHTHIQAHPPAPSQSAAARCRQHRHQPRHMERERQRRGLPTSRRLQHQRGPGDPDFFTRLDRISPFLSPFFPVFCAFSPSRRGGSSEAQAGTQGRETAGTSTKSRDLGPSFDTPDANQKDQLGPAGSDHHDERHELLDPRRRDV